MTNNNYFYFTPVMSVNCDKLILHVLSYYSEGNVSNYRPHGIASRITYSSIIIRGDASRRVGLFSLSFMKGHWDLKYR